MSPTTITDILQHLRCVWAAKEARDLSDSDLLQRFLSEEDEAAFAVLMQRHGPLVLGVCRRLTGDTHLAEDSFQGTFMVLARRARSIRKRASLASWLYGVAQHIAMRAKAQTASRRAQERRITDMPGSSPPDELTSQELQQILDEEIGNLADKYRSPLVLCYLEGKSHEAAARELKCPKTTLTNRLNRARELLHKRLTRRGVVLSTGALVSALTTQMAGAAVTARLTLSTVRAAMHIANGVGLAAAGLSARAALLAQEGMKATVAMSGKVVALVLMLGLTVGGASLVGYGGWREPDPAKPPPPVREFAQQPPPKPEKEQKKETPAVDLYGDPLPEGAVARLGTVRWRHGGAIRGAYFAGDGNTIVTSGAFGYGVGIWDAQTGVLRHRISVDRACFHLAISPDGKFIATDSLNLIDVKSGKEIRRLAPPPNNVQVVAVSPDGKLVATAEWTLVKGASVKFWDVATGNQLVTTEGHPEGVLALSFSPDSKNLATSSSDGIIRFFEVATGKLNRRFEMTNSPRDWIAYSPDGKLFADLSNRGISLWDLATGKVVREIKTNEATLVVAAFSPDGKLLATSDWNHKIRLWDVQTGQEIRSWPGQAIISLSFSRDGKTLIGAGWSITNVVRRWEVATGKKIDPPVGHVARVQSLQFAPDGRSLISRGAEHAIIEWDLTTLGQRRAIFSTSDLPIKKDHFWEFRDHSPDGKLVAVCGLQVSVNDDEKNVQDPAIRLWDTAAGKELHVLEGHAEQPGPVLFSPDGNLLVSKGVDGTRIWSAVTGKQLHHLTEPKSAVFLTPDGKRTVYWFFTPDSKQLVYWGDDKKLHFWDISAQKQVAAWDAPSAAKGEIHFSADGKILASVQSANLSVWAVNTGKELLKIGRSTVNGNLGACALSSNGRLVAVVESERRQLPNDERQQITTVRIIEVATGEDICRFEGPEAGVQCLVFSTDGRTLASGGSDSAILLWDLTGYAILGQAGKYQQPPQLNEGDLHKLWAVLAGDAAKAEKALWALSLSAKQSLPFLAKQLPYGPAADQKEVAKLIELLASATFATRQQAADALEKLGESAEAAVRKHLQGDITPEVRQRLDQFIKNRDKEVIRKLRAIEVLELINSAESRGLLETLATDSPNPRVAEAATGAMARLKKRQVQ